MECATKKMGASAISLTVMSKFSLFEKSVIVEALSFVVAKSAAYPKTHIRTISKPGS
jgi:hypothetical protein